MDHGVLNYEWSCPSCTYNNKPGAFKCHVCGTPKGTATRQTKYHSSTVERQVIAETMSQQLMRLQTSRTTGRPKSPTNSISSSSSGIIDASNSGSSNSGQGMPSHVSTSSGKSSTGRKRSKGHPEAKSKAAAIREDPWPAGLNINRSSGRSYKITVDGLTVTITEYDLLYPETD